MDLQFIQQPGGRSDNQFDANILGFKINVN